MKRAPLSPEAKAAAIARLQDAVRKAEQGAGLKYLKESEIDDEILMTLEKVIKAWSDLRDEILNRKGEWIQKASAERQNQINLARKARIAAGTPDKKPSGSSLHQRVIGLAIKANPAKSNRSIANEIGVNKDTVRNIRHELGGEYSPPKRKLGRTANPIRSDSASPRTQISPLNWWRQQRPPDIDACSYVARLQEVMRKFCDDVERRKAERDADELAEAVGRIADELGANV